MKNLAQLRALHAKEWAPSVKSGEGGSRAIAKKVPAQIIQNGFLGAFAFALEGNEGHLSVFKGVIQHLALIKKEGFDFGVAKLESNNPEAFFSELCSKSSDVLRSITAEAMEYLNYLRRFVK